MTRIPRSTRPRHGWYGIRRALAACLAALLPVQAGAVASDECQLHLVTAGAAAAMVVDAHAGHAMPGAMPDSASAPADQSACEHSPVASACGSCSAPALATIVAVDDDSPWRARAMPPEPGVPASAELVPDGPPPRR